jgi:hypothetical protein
MDSETIITYETPVAEIERIAHLIGNGLARIGEIISEILENGKHLPSGEE